LLLIDCQEAVDTYLGRGFFGRVVRASTTLETLAEKSGVIADKFVLLLRESLMAGVGETLSMVEALQQK